MTSPWGKLTALACHPTKWVNKAEELTYLSTNINKHSIILCLFANHTRPFETVDRELFLSPRQIGSTNWPGLRSKLCTFRSWGTPWIQTTWAQPCRRSWRRSSGYKTFIFAVTDADAGVQWVETNPYNICIFPTDICYLTS